MDENEGLVMYIRVSKNIRKSKIRLAYSMTGDYHMIITSNKILTSMHIEDYRSFILDNCRGLSEWI